jgi:uncharacterized protein (TIGR02145 family)
MWLNSKITISFILSGLFFILSSCENFLNNPSTEPFPNYTGQIDTVYDIEGNAYKTIGIGSQIWMAKNLRTTKLNDGTLISQIKSDSIWDYNHRYNHKTAFCWYNNDSVNNRNIYGALYNYYSVNSGLLCPVGWHVPNNSEWTTLVNFLGGTEKAGGKLKDYFTSTWTSPNICIANNYGFSALPGGERKRIQGRFYYLGSAGDWWTSTSIDMYSSYSRSLSNDNIKIYTYKSSIGDGYSVRCVKD